MAEPDGLASRVLRQRCGGALWDVAIRPLAGEQAEADEQLTHRGVPTRQRRVQHLLGPHERSICIGGRHEESAPRVREALDGDVGKPSSRREPPSVSGHLEQREETERKQRVVIAETRHLRSAGTEGSEQPSGRVAEVLVDEHRTRRRGSYEIGTVEYPARNTERSDGESVPG